jgi:peptidoglycan/LPS O-acetylase OafA/YrhL
MGILRTILALAVVVYHSYKLFGLRMCGGQVAVESFYMISGFYMALILNEKYVGVGYYKKFILSRFYRIFPVYWAILIAALLLSLVGYFGFQNPYYLTRYINNYSCLSGLTIFYFLLENIIVIGQDVLYFLRLDELCQPILTYNALSYKHTGYQYLLVPQAWSISIEFLFYLLAPFLVTKKLKWQVVLVLLGLIAKYYFFNYWYLSYDPWTYRFFPFELAFFMTGSVAYQIYTKLKDKNISPVIGYIMLPVLVGIVLFYEQLNLFNGQMKNSIFFSVVFMFLPFLFVAFKNSKIDRTIGELSFSLYISHHLIVSAFHNYFFSHPHYLYLYGYTVVFCSLMMAFLLQSTLVKYIETYRLKRFS